MKSIKGKLIGIVLLFIVIVGYINLSAINSSRQLKNDSLIINLAGRQRMLSQKFSKELYYYKSLQAEDRNDAANIVLKKLQTTQEIFGNTLRALLDGGSASTDLKQEKQATLPPTKDLEIRQQIEVVKEKWDALTAESKFFLSAIPGTSPYAKSQDKISELEPQVLSNMHKAVGMYAAASRMKGQHLFDIMINCLFVSLAAALLSFFIIQKKIVNPLAMLVKKVESLSEGNLNIKIDYNTSDEVGQVSEALKKHTARLRSTMSEIINCFKHISSEVESLKSSSYIMTDSSNKQAASVEQTSTAMDQINSNLREVSSLSVNSANEAEKCSNSVQETSKAMEKVANEISIIGEFARQTNLLALNAAIEAARAGKAGAGFAVVATEVRKLAEKSNHSATEINKIASSGLQTVKQTVDLLNILKPDITKSSDLIQAVSSETGDHESEIGQINEALAQLVDITQENATVAENINQSAEMLSDYTEKTQSMIDYFDISDDSMPSADIEANDSINQTMLEEESVAV